MVYAKKIAIAGIDPGTTTAFALIDIDRGIIKTGSAKEYPYSRLISDITQNNQIILVGCDKSKPPAFVEKVATKVGARLVYPNEDIKVAYKKELVGGARLNDHERDALASALFCYREYSALFTKIKETLSRLGKQHILDEVAALVVRNNIPIAMAIDIAEKPEEKKVQIIKKAIEKKGFSKEFIGLYENMKMLEQDNLLLKRQNTRLSSEIRKANKQREYFKKKINANISDEKAKRLISVKEDRLAEQYQLLKAKDDEIDSLQRIIAEQLSILAGINNKVVVKKLENLGVEEWQRKSKLICDSDIVLVENTAIISQNTVNELRKKVKYIIARKKTSQKLPFVVLVLDKTVQELRDFAIIEKENIERMIAKSSIIQDILAEYREERNKNG